MPGINLQIGGLVTTSGKGSLPITMTQSSMQKSLIGDTSPPSSICSSTGPLANDFGNETYSNGGAADKAQGLSSLNGYNMEDVKREIEMLQNLTFDGLATMDIMSNEVLADDATILIHPVNNNNNIDETFAGEIGKSFVVSNNNSTRRHHNLSNGGGGGINAVANGTFDLIGEEGGTCGQTMVLGGAGDIAEVDEDQEYDSENSTFNLTKRVRASTTVVVGAAADGDHHLVEVDDEEEEDKEHLELIEKEKVAELVMIEEDDIHLEFGREGGEYFIEGIDWGMVEITLRADKL